MFSSIRPDINSNFPFDSQLRAFHGLRDSEIDRRFARKKPFTNFDVFVVFEMPADDAKCGDAARYVVPVLR